MKYSQSEKMEIIGIVEGSSLSIRRTLERIAVSRSSFYQCSRRYQEDGYDGLAAAKRHQHYYWNRIPKEQRECVLKTARKYPEKSCREIAWYITDRQSFYVSESSVYRLLKAHDLITTPVYTMISACEKFSQPTRRMNQLWQTDFTYLKVVQWGWYYLSTVMDDFSRYIISWKLCTTMKASDVKEKITVQYRPRLLTDNGSCYIAGELREYLEKRGIAHTRGKLFHPMTQGKIERYHRSMKNLILLDHYYSPEELEERIEQWVKYYNERRYHEAIDNVTPEDKYLSRDSLILAKRKRLKEKTLVARRRFNQLAVDCI